MDIIETRRLPGFAKWPNDEKKKLLPNLFVKSPKVKEILEEIEDCRLNSKYMEEPKCICIYGDTGVGKSYITKSFIKGFQPYDKEYSDRIQRIVPVLRTRVTPKTNGTALALKIRESLGDPFYSKGSNTTDKISAAQRILKNCEVELVILDEVQHVIDRDSKRPISEAADWIKMLVEETNIPFVLVGLPTMFGIMEANEQLDGRFKIRKEIEPFGMDTPEKAKEFKTYLNVVDLKIPLPECSDLHDDRIAGLLFEGSKGVNRVLMEQIIIPATIKAIDLHLPNLSYGLLEDQVKKVLRK